MKIKCPYCSPEQEVSAKVLKTGRFYRKSQRKWIQRYYCTVCKSHFSSATKSVFVGQNKRHLNMKVYRLLVSGVSQRRISRLLKIHPITVARILKRMALWARKNQREFLKNYPKVDSFQFDELETIEHTKMKPLSVMTAVEEKTRKILDFEVSKMPAKGLLARKSRKKYGSRQDERAKNHKKLFKRLKNHIHEKAEILSDQNPSYPPLVKKYFPRAYYERVKGQRGCIAGQGELKKIGFDPLFSLNHTYAMMRANINRLFRRTWNTTKDPKRLKDHIDLYVWYHNSELTL